MIRYDMKFYDYGNQIGKKSIMYSLISTVFIFSLRFNWMLACSP